MNIDLSNNSTKTECCSTNSTLINDAKIKLGDVCLDIGCGHGTNVIRIADKVGEHGFVNGIEFSEETISKARLSAKKLGINNVDFITSDRETLEIKSQSIDVIISNYTINKIEKKQKIFNEIYRILKKGGRIVISDIYAKEPVPIEFRTNPQMIAECWAGATTKEEYLRILENAGFTTIEIIEESKPYKKGEIYISNLTFTSTKDICCL